MTVHRKTGRKMSRKMGLIVATAAIGGGLALTPSAGAAAAPAQGEQTASASCPWPNVCFYKGSKRVATYKDMGYQKLGPKARSATKIHNSRKDDGAKIYYRHSSGKTATRCATPGQTRYVNAGWDPVAIDIRNSPSCK